MITPSVSPPERYKNPLDYVLVAGTCVLFAIYLPLFTAAPRLLSRINALDLYWFLPLVVMLSSMFVLFRWAVHGATNVLRMLWVVTLILAGMGAVLAYPVVILMGMGNTPQHHYAQPRPAPEPVPVEPPLPVPPLERP